MFSSDFLTEKEIYNMILKDSSNSDKFPQILKNLRSRITVLEKKRRDNEAMFGSHKKKIIQLQRDQKKITAANLSLESYLETYRQMFKKLHVKNVDWMITNFSKVGTESMFIDEEEEGVSVDTEKSSPKKVYSIFEKLDFLRESLNTLSSFSEMQSLLLYFYNHERSVITSFPSEKEEEGENEEELNEEERKSMQDIQNCLKLILRKLFFLLGLYRNNPKIIMLLLKFIALYSPDFFVRQQPVKRKQETGKQQEEEDTDEEEHRVQKHLDLAKILFFLNAPSYETNLSVLNASIRLLITKFRIKYDDLIRTKNFNYLLFNEVKDKDLGRENFELFLMHFGSMLRFRILQYFLDSYEYSTIRESVWFWETFRNYGASKNLNFSYFDGDEEEKNQDELFQIAKKQRTKEMKVLFRKEDRFLFFFKVLKETKRMKIKSLILEMFLQYTHLNTLFKYFSKILPLYDHSQSGDMKTSDISYFDDDEDESFEYFFHLTNIVFTVIYNYGDKKSKNGEPLIDKKTKEVVISEVMNLLSIQKNCKLTKLVFKILNFYPQFVPTSVGDGESNTVIFLLNYLYVNFNWLERLSVLLILNLINKMIYFSNVLLETNGEIDEVEVLNVFKFLRQNDVDALEAEEEEGEEEEGEVGKNQELNHSGERISSKSALLRERTEIKTEVLSILLNLCNKSKDYFDIVSNEKTFFITQDNLDDTFSESMSFQDELGTKKKKVERNIGLFQWVLDHLTFSDVELKFVAKFSDSQSEKLRKYLSDEENSIILMKNVKSKYSFLFVHRLVKSSVLVVRENSSLLNFVLSSFSSDTLIRERLVLMNEIIKQNSNVIGCVSTELVKMLIVRYRMLSSAKEIKKELGKYQKYVENEILKLFNFLLLNKKIFELLKRNKKLLAEGTGFTENLYLQNLLNKLQ